MRKGRDKEDKKGDSDSEKDENFDNETSTRRSLDSEIADLTQDDSDIVIMRLKEENSNLKLAIALLLGKVEPAQLQKVWEYLLPNDKFPTPKKKDRYPAKEIRARLYEAIINFQPSTELLERLSTSSLKEMASRPLRTPPRSNLYDAMEAHPLYTVSIDSVQFLYNQSVEKVFGRIKDRCTKLFECEVKLCTPGRVTGKNWKQGARVRWRLRYSKWEFTTIILLYADETPNLNEDDWHNHRKRHNDIEEKLHLWMKKEHTSLYKKADKHGDDANYDPSLHFYIYLAAKC
jgi:hypothetical protein